MKILTRIIRIAIYFSFVIVISFTFLTVLASPRMSQILNSEGVISRSHELHSHIGLLEEFGFYQQRDSAGLKLYIITDQIEYAKKQTDVVWEEVKLGDRPVLIPNAKVTSNNIPITLETFKKVRLIFVTSHIAAALSIIVALFIGLRLLSSFIKEEYFKSQNHRSLSYLGILIILYPVIQYAAHYWIFGAVFFQEELIGIKASLTGEVSMNWTLVVAGVMTIIFSAALKKGWEIKQENELTV